MTQNDEIYKTMLDTIKRSLRKYASPEQARVLQGFFKTAPGEYGAGDIFIGVKVPQVRIVAKRFYDAGLSTVRQLLKSEVHEERLCALMLLVLRFPKVTPAEQKEIYDFYLEHTAWINNWDLVDLSAHHIVGAYLEDMDKHVLKQLARSQNLWERRIAIIATFHDIRRGVFDTTLTLAKILIEDEHDLMHKAVGWMLREIGKRDRVAEETFLKKHYAKMPRTMLRYAIEKFPEPMRQAYLKGRV